MTQHIDFLPASYHRERGRKRNRMWRRALVLVSSGLVAVGSAQLWQMQNTLKQNRDRLLVNAQSLSSQLADPALLKERLRRHDVAAELLTRLELRASPTRVLHAVTRVLPEFVSLTEYRTQYEESPTSRFGRGTQTPQPEEEATHPAEEDLRSLVGLSEGRSLIVTVQGLAPHDIAISSYLARLQDTELFDEVKLLYTDERSYGDFSMRTFGVRLEVRAPRTSADDAATANGMLSASHFSNAGGRP